MKYLKSSAKWRLNFRSDKKSIQEKSFEHFFLKSMRRITTHTVEFVEFIEDEEIFRDNMMIGIVLM